MVLTKNNVLLTFLRVCEKLERRMPRGYSLEKLARRLPRLSRAICEQDRRLRRCWASVLQGEVEPAEFGPILASWARAMRNAFQGFQVLYER